MYIKVDDEFADGEFVLLSELIALLDDKIIEINSLIKKSCDPESDGLTDRGEYFIGVGFTAMQQYIVDTLTLTNVSKKQSFLLGPKYSENVTYSSAINSAANWWKHSAEWYGEKNKKPHPESSKTIDIVESITSTKEYTLSNLLANLVKSNDISLTALLPYLEEWRLSIDKADENNA